MWFSKNEGGQSFVTKTIFSSNLLTVTQFRFPSLVADDCDCADQPEPRLFYALPIARYFSYQNVNICWDAGEYG
jgi:hypothetical protein